MPAPYSSTLAEHLNSPRNAGEMESPDAIGRVGGGSRPPYIVIYLKVRARVVSEARFQTFGCGYSIATSSALTEMAIGKTTDECSSISAEQLIEALEGMPENKQFFAQFAIDALRNALAQLEDRPEDPERQ